MSENTSITALKAQYALGLVGHEQLAKLDRRSRREVEQFGIEIAALARKHFLAQEAVAMVHTLTLNQVNTTLASAEFLKSMRSPLIAGADLEQHDAAARARFLEASSYINIDVTRKILAMLE